MKNYKYLLPITAFFITILLVSNITSTKIVDLSFRWIPIIFDGGTLLFPLSYIFGDILTEVYGYKQSRKVIWLGFAAAAVMSLCIMAIGALPPASDRPFQADYMNILWYTPRIVVASLIAYRAGEFSNSYILAKMKIRTKGKLFGVRAIGSTIVGQGIDTMLFVLVAFAGTLPRAIIRAIVITNYIFKIWIEVILLPITYRIVQYLKKTEHEDYYDTKTNFNPFLIK